MTWKRNVLGINFSCRIGVCTHIIWPWFLFDCNLKLNRRRFSIVIWSCQEYLSNYCLTHIGALFAELTKTVPSLHMHRYLSAINRNSNGKSWCFFFQIMQINEAMYAYIKKEVYHWTLECFSYLFSCLGYSSSTISYTISRCLASPTAMSCSMERGYRSSQFSKEGTDIDILRVTVFK